MVYSSAIHELLFYSCQKKSDNLSLHGPTIFKEGIPCSDLFGLTWRRSEVKYSAPYLNRNNSYLHRLARHFGFNWRVFAPVQ